MESPEWGQHVSNQLLHFIPGLKARKNFVALFMYSLMDDFTRVWLEVIVNALTSSYIHGSSVEAWQLEFQQFWKTKNFTFNNDSNTLANLLQSDKARVESFALLDDLILI